MKKWEKELTCDLILKDMERLDLPRKMSSFILVVDEHIEAYLRYAFQCPLTKNILKWVYQRSQNLFLGQ